MTIVYEGKGKRALITGASSGIGVELARVFAEHGFDLILVARRRDKMEALAEELARDMKTDCHIIVADLADPAAPRAIFDEVTARGLRVDALVNNAGYGIPGFFRDTKWEDQAALLQVMVTSLTELCHLFGPCMKARGYGRILNVASVAGHLPASAGGTLYSASKAFVIKLSEALHFEYLGTNVNVTALCPGFTWSEFHDVMGNREEMNRLPKFLWLDTNHVAREGFRAVMENDPVYTNGFFYRLIAWIADVIPDHLLYWLIGRQTGRKTSE